MPPSCRSAATIHSLDDVAIQELSARDNDLRPVVGADWAVRVEDLALVIPIDGAPNAWRPILRGLTLRVTDEALREGLQHATTIVDRLSKTRVDEFLDQLSAAPWLRSFRWYYASLLRLAAVENGLDLAGEIVAGGIVAHARLRPAADRGFFGQLRDLAKGAVTITARITPSVGDRGRLRLHLALEPDVRGLVAKLLVGAMAKRPGVYRFDDDTVEIDLAFLIAQEASTPVEWDVVIQTVDVAPGELIIVFGPWAGDVE